MDLSQSRHNMENFLIPSCQESTTMTSAASLPFLENNSTRDERAFCCNSCNDLELSYKKMGQRSKGNKLISALKEKIIGDRNSIRSINSENEDLSSLSSRSISEIDEDEENDEEEETYRNNENFVIDSLKEKYVCLNFEFNQLQERHGKFAGNRKHEEECTHSDSSDNALERKFTQIFHEVPPSQIPKIRHSEVHQTQKKDKRAEDKENIPLCEHNNKELKSILKILKKLFRSPPMTSRDTSELKRLYQLVKSLQEEQQKFRNIIKEQQAQLNDFHRKYIHAQDVIQSQKCEINQLYATNTQLENELNTNINELKEKFQDKINEVSHLPRTVKSEKAKCDKLNKENCSLILKLQQIKQELANARSKLEEACQKRSKILNKLKTAERDLKIFRTQNSTLKAEKRTLYEELRKLRAVNDDLKSTSSKSISRQKERGETQIRLLRKKIIDLEMELNRSRNSTNTLVEERDKLIAELHMQLNTLVHNFEVSQKHIRILRRHIYSLSSNQGSSERNA